MKKLGRNDTCHCGSGKKYKKCCLEKDEKEKSARALYESEKNKESNNDPLDNDFEDIIEEEELNNYFEENKDIEYEKNRKKYVCKKFEENLPEISAEKHKIIDEWWEELKKIYKETDENPTKIKNHIETFLNDYPELAINQEIHHEVIFELEASYKRKGNYDEFIVFLKWYREKFSEAYALSATCYDYYLIAYSLIKKEIDNISLYFSYYQEYPDHAPDKLMDVMELLIANNCEDLIIKLLKDIYPYIYYSSNVINSYTFVLPILFSKYIPYIKPDYTENDIELLINDLKEIDSQILEMGVITKKYYYKKMLENMFNTPDLNNYKYSLRDYYQHIGRNYLIFLYKHKNKSWITAYYYSFEIEEYLNKMDKEKKENPNFIFNKKKIESYILNHYRSFFGLKPVPAITFLQAVYFFAEVY